MKLVWEPLYGVEMDDRSKRKKCLKMKIHEFGAVIQFNPVGATLYKKKKQILFERVILYGRAPLRSEDRGKVPRRKLLEKVELWGVVNIKQPCRNNRLEVNTNLV